MIILEDLVFACECVYAHMCTCVCMYVSTVFAMIFSLEELLGHKAGMSVVR